MSEQNEGQLGTFGGVGVAGGVGSVPVASREGDAGSGVESKKETPLRRFRIGSERSHKVQRFFENIVIGAGELHPTDDWDRARNAYSGDDIKVMTNLWRSKVDTQASFLDSDPPKVRFHPPEFRSDDEVMKLRARLESGVYDYISREQGFLDSLHDMRHSADLTNVGFACLRPDYKKMLPELVFLDNEQVSVDAECGGKLANAGWVAYHEMTPPERLAELIDDIPLDVFREAATFKATKNDATGGSREKAQLVLDTETTMNRCKVWRIFARNEYALYDTDPAESSSDEPDRQPQFKRFDSLRSDEEPRRYLLLVEGMKDPVVDIDGWPAEYLLDSGEWPIFLLAYNEKPGTIYGFTDYIHEKPVLQAIEKATRNLVEKMSIQGLKLGGRTGGPEEKAVASWIEKTGVQYLPDALDAQGQPAVSVVDMGGLTQQDVTFFDKLIDIYDQVAMQPRAARGAETAEKTATATQIENERQAARNNDRLRKFEVIIGDIARVTMQMAHVMCKKMTVVRSSLGAVLDVAGGSALDATGMPLPDLDVVSEYEMTWDMAEQVLASPDTELVQLGVDAMVGVELAEGWNDWPDVVNSGMASLVLRGIWVNVERGSTQAHVRLQKAASFREVFATMIAPLAQTIGAPDAMVEAIDKVLGMMDLNEFTGIVNALKQSVAMAAQAQAEAQAAGMLPPEQGEPLPKTGTPPNPEKEGVTPYAGV